ncbi:hypothetical protein B0H17DRAFT_1209603 [Mycena rosella]|uniref:Uncharacterized protein n=1 Tax=Mycena rosella TaxID=1033263 RepID=A0AAD7CY30_MYCRO|nr:hypothetical protein B0H17DRAFT_1209603 [Mycena rosella]
MSPPSPPPSLTVFTGAVDDKRLKNDLKAMAEALNLDTKSKSKAVLARLISTLLFEDYPSHEEDPRFAELYKYRKSHPLKAPKESKTKKLSASKVAEDLAEQSKPAKAITGANLKLLDAKVTTDPPGSFGRLGLQVKTEGLEKPSKGAKPQEDGGSSPLTTSSVLEHGKKEALPPVGAEGDKETEDSEEEESTSDAEEKTSSELAIAGPKSVLVKLYHPTRANQEPQQIYVPNISVVPNETGGVKTRLSQLIPAAIQSNSPMKSDVAGRFLRRAVGGGSGTMQVGSVAQHLEGKIPQSLEWKTADFISLQPASEFGEDVFGCDLFYEPSDTLPVLQLPTSLTGAKSDVPLAIARARGQASQIQKPVKQAYIPHFGTYLLELVQSGTLDQPTNLTAGIAVKNYVHFEAFLELFAPYRHKAAGYLIPASNRGLFIKAKALSGKLGKWAKAAIKSAKEGAPEVSDEEERPGAIYENMGYGEFRDLVDKKYAQLEEDKAKALGSSSKVSSSKRARRLLANESEGSSDEEAPKKKKKYSKKNKAEEEPVKKNKKKERQEMKVKDVKGKGRASGGSENLDESSSSEESDS